MDGQNDRHFWLQITQNFISSKRVENRQGVAIIFGKILDLQGPFNVRIEKAVILATSKFLIKVAFRKFTKNIKNKLD